MILDPAICSDYTIISKYENRTLIFCEKYESAEVEIINVPIYGFCKRNYGLFYLEMMDKALIDQASEIRKKRANKDK